MYLHPILEYRRNLFQVIIDGHFLHIPFDMSLEFRVFEKNARNLPIRTRS